MCQVRLSLYRNESVSLSSHFRAVTLLETRELNGRVVFLGISGTYLFRYDIKLHYRALVGSIQGTN